MRRGFVNVPTILLLGLAPLLSACSANTASKSVPTEAAAAVRLPSDASRAVPDGEDAARGSPRVDEESSDPEPNNSQMTVVPPATQPEPVLGDQDERQRKLVIGTWEDDYQGHRTMTLHEDGTGTMIVELQGVQAVLFAARLEFHMQWSVAGGRLKKRTVGGRPEGRVSMILKMMGDRVDEPILQLTESRLLLLDRDGVTQYDWRRKMGGSAPTSPNSDPE